MLKPLQNHSVGTVLLSRLLSVSTVMDSLWVAGEKANVNVVSKWSSGDWEQYLTCLASLAVFGGSSEILRLGARLMDRADSKMFTAIAIQRAEGQVDVIEDSEGAVSTCNLAQVLPVPDVLPAPELLTLLLDQGVIETLAKVLQRPEGLHGGESESNASVESVLASELVSANLRSLAFVLHHDEIKRRFLSLGMNTFGPFGYCCFFFCGMFFPVFVGQGKPLDRQCFFLVRFIDGLHGECCILFMWVDSIHIFIYLSKTEWPLRDLVRWALVSKVKIDTESTVEQEDVVDSLKTEVIRRCVTKEAAVSVVLTKREW